MQNLILQVYMAVCNGIQSIISPKSSHILCYSNKMYILFSLFIMFLTTVHIIY